jgi:hypothetical protein
MLLTSDTPPPVSPLSRHDSVFLLVLAMALLLATASFFAPFAVTALLAGALLSIGLHRWPGDTSLADVTADSIRLKPINIAAVHVGGDAGGLIFVLGAIAILGLGLPMLRWFLIASVAAAGALAVARIAWKRA